MTTGVFYWDADFLVAFIDMIDTITRLSLALYPSRHLYGGHGVGY
jgi:hypothetical protein